MEPSFKTVVQYYNQNTTHLSFGICGGLIPRPTTDTRIWDSKFYGQPALCIQGGSAFSDLSNHWSCSTYCIDWKYSKYNWTMQFKLVLFIDQLWKWKSLSGVWPFVTPWTVGILQARTLEWVAVPFFMGSSQPRDWTQVSCMAGGFLTSFELMYFCVSGV